MWALLPVKRFATGKMRLAAVLSASQRACLTCRMLNDVLDVLRHAPSIQKIVVLSNEPGIDAVLSAADVERCPDAYEGDVNRSLLAAASGLPSCAGRILILPSDVPAIRVADVEALSRAHRALCGSNATGVVLCPAAVDGGTNALLSSLPLLISLQFGAKNSLNRHLDSARQHQVAARVVTRGGLARDVDRPEDLDWLADHSHSGRTPPYVRQLRQARREEVCKAV